MILFFKITFWILRLKSFKSSLIIIIMISLSFDPPMSLTLSNLEELSGLLICNFTGASSNCSNFFAGVETYLLPSFKHAYQLSSLRCPSPAIWYWLQQLSYIVTCWTTLTSWLSLLWYQIPSCRCSSVVRCLWPQQQEHGCLDTGVVRLWLSLPLLESFHAGLEWGLWHSIGTFGYSLLTPDDLKAGLFSEFCLRHGWLVFLSLYYCFFPRPQGSILHSLVVHISLPVLK